MDVSQNAMPTDIPDARHLAAATIIVPPHVVHRTLVEETVVLDLRTGTYHGLNVTGGRMLELLQENGDFDMTVDRLVVEYNETSAKMRGDLRAFCGKLLQHGLISLT